MCAETWHHNSQLRFQLFPRFPIENIRLFDEYTETREKFTADPANKELFESIIKRAEALKQLEAIFRYTELVLFEVKHDQMRRSERNFINWAEEQRSILFAKNPIKVFSFLNIIQFQNLYSTIINNVGSFLNVEK